jgi:DNA-binding LytR/AlgR family response regulator
MKLKCLLIDDEPHAVRLLESYIQAIGRLEVTAVCQNALEAVDVLLNKSIDVIFLDITMPKLLGTEFIRAIKNPPMVIFTTAYKEYALDGFELDAIDYLVKPISMERFLRAVNKITAIGEKTVQPPVTNNTIDPNAFLYFRCDRKMVKLLLRDVLYIEGMKDYVRIVRHNDKPLVVKQSIGLLEEMLPDRGFLRIHRSYIISVDKIRSFTHQDVDMGGIDIPIGRLYSARVTKLIPTHRGKGE